MNNDELTLEGVKQFYVNVEEEDWKFATLVDFYETLAISQSVIFVNNSLKVELLYDELHLAGHCVSATHEDMDENTREVIMEQFRSGKHERAHVTTDGLLARGIDSKYVSLIVNYDLPTKPEDYLRRIGRNGRSRRNVVVINFVTNEDDGVLANIEKFYDVEIKELPANVGDLL